MTVTARAFFYIQQIEQLTRRRIDECLQPEGITAGQYMVLSLVAHQEPISSADLARRANMTAQSMGEFIKTLETKGLVERRACPKSRRTNLILSTPAGRKTLVHAESKVDNAEREFFSCLSTEDIANLRFQLSRVRHAELERLKN